MRVIEHRYKHLRLALDIIVIVSSELNIDIFQHKRKPAGTFENGEHDFQELPFRAFEIRLIGFRPCLCCKPDADTDPYR